MTNRQEQLDSLFRDASPHGGLSVSNLKLASAELGLCTLYEHIGAPNRLPQDLSGSSSDVRTAYDLDFTKLPDNLYAPMSAESESTQKEEVKLEKPDRFKNHTIEGNTTQLPDLTCPQTLCQLYSKQDPNLVYLKHGDQGSMEVKQQFFASYYVNIENLLKGQVGKMQRKDSDKLDTLTTQRDGPLQFNSLFESGNLYAAYKVSENEYDLILQNDINTRGHTQWFFFSVENALKGQTIKFNIINLLKPESLFNEGMKPVVFSVLGNSTTGEEWKREGSNISYFKNNILWEGSSAKPYYTLTFTYTFQHTNDKVYFAHSFPYTYLNLKQFLTDITNDPKRKQFVVKRTLCYTLCKNECEYLSVTSPYNIDSMSQRYGIVITGRQHPGESLSSYMMEGFISFITSECPEAVFLREHCVFKIVPMLNPDGVIHGNYRTSLSGRDLNRSWNKPSQTIHPTIYHTKELIKKFQLKRKIKLVCDLHGHSRKKNAFFYGNSAENDPFAPRMFPFILSKLSKYVSFEDCRFKVQKSKENTARVNLWQELGIPNVVTLEASFFGYDYKKNTYSFDRDDYRNLGKDLGEAIYIYIKEMFPVSNKKNKENSMEKIPTKVSEKSKVSKLKIEVADYQNLMEELRSNDHLIDAGNRDDDSGSDTNNSDDDIPNKELNRMLPLTEMIPIRIKKKKTLELLKKKSSSLAPTKKEEKLIELEKVDRSLNNESPLPTQDKLKPKPTRPLSSRTKIKKIGHISKISLSRSRFLTQDLPDITNQAIMADKSIQTDNIDSEMPPDLSSIYSKVLNFNNGKLRLHSKTSKSKLAVQSLVESGGLVVLGAKTGLDSNGGIDTSYQLGRGQTSRAVLAKPDSSVTQKETSRSYTPYMPYRQSPEDFTPWEKKNEKKMKPIQPGGGFKGSLAAKSSFSKDKSEDLRLQRCHTEMNSVSPIGEICDDIIELTERKKSHSQKTFHHKQLLPPSRLPKYRLLADQKAVKPKALSPSPLQEFLSSAYIKTEPRELHQTETYTTLNESKRITMIDEAYDDSLWKTNVSKAPTQHLPSPNLLLSKRSYDEKIMKQKERITAAKLKGLFGSHKLTDPNIYRSKDKEPSPALRTNTAKPVYMSEYKAELEQKIVEMGLKAKNERKSQRSARKI